MRSFASIIVLSIAIGGLSAAGEYGYSSGCASSYGSGHTYSASASHSFVSTGGGWYLRVACNDISQHDGWWYKRRDLGHCWEYTRQVRVSACNGKWISTGGRWYLRSRNGRISGHDGWWYFRDSCGDFVQRSRVRASGNGHSTRAVSVLPRSPE